MRKANFGMLVVITAVAAVAAVFAQRHRGAEGSAPAPVGPLFPELSARINDVTALTVTSAEASVTIRRDGDTWRIDERDGYPARFEAVKETLMGVAELRTLEAKTSRPELYGKLGLAEPETEGSDSTLLTLTGAQGSALAAVLVGHTGPEAETLFVRRSGDSQCWLARGSLTPERQATQWMDRELIKVPASRVREVAITHPDGEKVAVSREKAEDPDWQIQGVPEDSEPKSPGLGRSLAIALESFSLDDVATAEKQPLPAEGRIATVFETFDGLRVTVTTATVEGKTWAALKAEATEAADDAVKAEAAALEAKLSPWVFVIPEYRGTNLRQHLAELIQPKAEPTALPDGDAAAPTEDAALPPEPLPPKDGEPPAPSEELPPQDEAPPEAGEDP